MSRKPRIPGSFWEKGEKIWSLKTSSKCIGSVFQIDGGWAYLAHFGNGGAKASYTYPKMSEAMAALEKEVAK